jgi:predicted phage terminase large subunit-like protein
MNAFLNTVLSRHDDKRTGAIVIIMQRVHMDDLTGFVLRKSDDWTVLTLPAIAEGFERIRTGANNMHLRRPGELLSPEREPLSALNNLRQLLGSDVFSAQYQQAPVPPEGAMIKRHWVQRHKDPPARSREHFVFQSWDTAAKGGPDNDWSVCTTWLMVDAYYYLPDVWQGRVDYPTLKQRVKEYAEQWSADQVLVKESGTAIGLLQELAHCVRGLTSITPEKDKKSRMSMASAIFEAKQVFFPEQASWLPELEAELFSFPSSRHDDQADSISQALNHGKVSSLWVSKKLGEAS